MLERKEKYLMKKLNHHCFWFDSIIECFVIEILDHCEDYSDFDIIASEMFEDFTKYWSENDLRELLEYCFENIGGFLHFGGFGYSGTLAKKLVDWLADDFFGALNEHCIDIVEIEQE